MKKGKKQILPTQAELMASTRRLEALRSGRQFQDKKKVSKADVVGRKAKHKGGQDE